MNNLDDDDKSRDFFGETEVPDPEPKVKKPVYKDDDPRYYSQEPSPWEHLCISPRWKVYLYCGLGVAFIGLVIFFWLRYFSPYVTDASQVGYIERIDKEGDIFKTFEGVMLPYRELRDTTRLYDRDFVFSAQSDTVAAKIKVLMNAGRPVRLSYKKYHGTLPWRGKSRIVVTAVDTVDPSLILPPEFRPYEPEPKPAAEAGDSEQK